MEITEICCNGSLIYCVHRGKNIQLVLKLTYNRKINIIGACLILPLAASGTVISSPAKLSSSGKCWHSDLARIWRKVDFPSTVFVVLSCGKTVVQDSRNLLLIRPVNGYIVIF